MDLQIREKTTQETPNFLDSVETLRFRTGGVTIDATTVPADGAGKKIIKGGRLIESLENGKFQLMPAAPTAGREYVMLWRTLDCTNGDQVGAAIDHGRVREARLPAPVTAAQKQVLPGITFRA
jgi:hypothetical protein